MAKERERRAEGEDRAVEGGPTGLRVRGKGDNYYFKKMVGGHRHTIPIVANSDARAIQKAMEILDDIARGTFRPDRYRQNRSSIARFLDDALGAIAARAQHAPKTIAAYRGRIRHFTKYLEERHPRVLYVRDVSPEVARGYVDWRRAQLVSRSGKARPETRRHKPAAQTVHDDVRRLRALFKVAVERHILDANPFEEVRVPVKERDKQILMRALSEAEVRRLLEAADAYDAAPRGPGAEPTFRGMMRQIVEFYLQTGLRKEELIYLPWKHVDLDWGGHGLLTIGPVDVPVVLRIRPHADQVTKVAKLAESLPPGEKLFRDKAQVRACLPHNYAEQEMEAILEVSAEAWKPEEERLHVPTRVAWKQKATQGTVPLNRTSRAIIDARLQVRAKSPFVFPHPDDGPLRSDPLPQFKLLLKAAKLPASVRLHDLRHTFGMTLRSKGTRIETLMGLMRHKNIEETMIYAKYSPEEGAVQIETLDGFGATS